MTHLIEKNWPLDNLEHVGRCPYCGSNDKVIAFKDAQDWSFYCAPGKWDYWDCMNCQSIYLDPRPTQSSVGRAYLNYYTHGDGNSISFLRSFKKSLRNECLSLILNSNIAPRLSLPKIFNSMIRFIGKQVTVPFGWELLANLPKGRFLDVGCGSGLTVAFAKQSGWDAVGIEIDPAAVIEAKKAGLNISEGTYELLSDLESQFDCVMCSHVLEHVHDPIDLLRNLKIAVKPGGLLLITLPNALSPMRRYFGSSWRGLEAPRHISIPSESRLSQLIKDAGFSIEIKSGTGFETATESYRIQRRGFKSSIFDTLKALILKKNKKVCKNETNDFIYFLCRADYQ